MFVRNFLALGIIVSSLAWCSTRLARADDKPEKTTLPPKLELKPAPAPYPTAHTKALDAKEQVVNEAEDHTQYRVEFTGVKDDRVPAYLYVPKRDASAKPCPAILLQYGSGGNKKTNYIVEIGKQFVHHGFVVLTIDSPNQGERRTKENKAGGLFGLAGTEQVMHYCGDYSRAVDFLEARPEVDKNRLGYVGISWGAITGIIYVAYDPRIKALGSMVGGGNFLGLFTPEDAERCAREGSKSSDPVCHIARIAPRPLLFVNVKQDQLIMRPWAESLHKWAGPDAKIMWLDTDHYFRGLDRGQVCESVIEFMEKSLTKRTAEKK